MTVPVRPSKLDPYGEEVLRLHRQGRKLAEISKYLAQTYGLSVALSTLSEYVNRDRTSPPRSVPTEAVPTAAQEMFLDQVEVYAEIQASIRVVVDEVQAMRNAFPDLAGLEGQISALGRRIEALKAVAPPALPSRTSDDLTALLPQLRAFLERGSRQERPPEASVPHALIRRIWIRSLWITAIFWLILLAGAAYGLGLWRLPAFS